MRTEIAHSAERTGVLAQRYGVSTETIRKWRKHGPGAGADRSSRSHRLRWRAAANEQRIICLLRRKTRFALDDLAAAVRHFLPQLTRDTVYRVLTAHGLARLSDLPPAYEAPRSRKGTGRFQDYGLGFVHVEWMRSICRSCARRTATCAGVTCSSPSIAAPAPYTSP